jgi:ABC-type branched-subunit amino acid transport system ATPase component
MPSTIEFQGLVKRFGQVTAVHDFTLSVRAGEFLALVGPSGCGKTTSLRILAGLETSTAGRILLDGADITGTAAKDRDLAMVFQTYALYPHMTVAANIGFALELRRVPRAAAQAAICSGASRASCRAASASASPSPVPSCATPAPSCSTSRCPTSMPSSASRRGRSCGAFSATSAPPPSMSPTTRPRP